jgi:hypothetical protein
MLLGMHISLTFEGRPVAILSIAYEEINDKEE